MTALFEKFSLPVVMPDAPAARRTRKGLSLTDLQAGETARILRVGLADSGCRKRLAELGLVEGMKVTILSAGGGAGTVMLQVGGAKMALGEGCAAEVFVTRV